MNNFEIKKKIVLSGNSRIFNDWSKHSSITMEEFIEALEWVCNDPLNEQGKMTREIGLSPTGIVKLFRANRKDGLCFFYKDGELWGGEGVINMMYIIRDREAGNEIARFSSLAEAEQELRAYEEADKNEGNFTEDFYEIVTE